MNVNRRKFLSMGAGAAAGIGAGTILSPLPWKLLDDSAIWTQNWPWTPVPQEGKATYRKTTCTLCPGKCGISVRRIDKRVVKIEGMKNHPVNQGGICLLGLSGPQLLYSPTRVKGPMKKVGNQWKEISWNDAISEVVSRLSELRSKGKSHTVACIAGEDRGMVSRLFERFLTAYGSPNFISSPSIIDSYELAITLLHNGLQATPGFDFENANFVLSFGSGLLDGWGAPVRMFKANSNWKDNNIDVYQIEPRLSNTAAKSKKWIPINPGTESILALGIANIIIQEGLTNSQFIETATTDFNTWKQFLSSNYSPGAVAEKTGVSKTVMEDMARKFARASNPIAVCGRGKGMTPDSMNEVMAVYLLNALVGSINRKGGVFTVPHPSYIEWPEVTLDEVAKTGMGQKRLDGARAGKYAKTRHLLNRLPQILATAKEPPVELLFVSDANPFYTLSNTEMVKTALGKVPFIVSFSSYLDETAKNANLILPNHCYLERYEDVPPIPGLTQSVIGLTKRVSAPQLKTMHTGDVILSIAKAMGGTIAGSFPWDEFDACMKTTLAGQWDTLKKEIFLVTDDYDSTLKKAILAAESNKIEFPPVIRYFKERVALEGDNTAFPLTLVPYDTMTLASGPIGDPPFALKTVSDTTLKGKDTVIEINPETARKLGIDEGGFAELKTPVAAGRVKVHFFDGIVPDVVAMPRGLGHTAYDDFLANKGINYNMLIDPVPDPVSGLDAAYGIKARLTKV